MRYCEKCRVHVDEPLARCPLCSATLTPEDGERLERSYPRPQAPLKRHVTVLRVCLFLSIAMSLAAVEVEYLLCRRVIWSLMGIVNLAFVWFMVISVLKRRLHVGYQVIFGLIITSLTLRYIDFRTGNLNWSMDYAIPFLCISAIVSITIIMLINHNRLKDYILYLLVTVLIGFVPCILLFTDLVAVDWPAVTSGAYALLTLAGMVIFMGKETKSELKRRFHW